MAGTWYTVNVTQVLDQSHFYKGQSNSNLFCSRCPLERAAYVPSDPNLGYARKYGPIILGSGHVLSIRGTSELSHVGLGMAVPCFGDLLRLNLTVRTSR